VRGGGGDDWYRSHYGVRRPSRARVRQERVGEWRDRKGAVECFEVDEEAGIRGGRRRMSRYEGSDGCSRRGRRDSYDGWTSSIDGCWLLCCGGGRPRRRRTSRGSGWVNGAYAKRGRVVCTIDD